VGERGRFLHLDERAGWRAAALQAVVVSPAGSLRLDVLPGTARPLADAQGTFGGLTAPTGLVVDGDEIYVLDAVHHVLRRFDPCSCSFAVVPCVGGRGTGPREWCNPHGIAISRRRDLYVADTGNRRVQVLSLNGLVLRAILGPFRVIREGGTIRVSAVAPTHTVAADGVTCEGLVSYPAEAWEPFDVAVTRSGCLYVSDSAQGLIHEFDARGRWSRAFDGASADSPPFVRPTHIALDRAGRIYVVQDARPFVVVLDAAGRFLERVEQPAQVDPRFCPTDIAVAEDGALYLGERFTRRLHAYRSGANGRHHYTGSSPHLPDAPCAIAFDRHGNPVVAGRTGGLARLDGDPSFVTSGHYFSEPLDSRIHRCEWHRVGMRAAIPEGTAVQVDTLTADGPKDTADVLALPDARWARAAVNDVVGSGTWDCLIQSPPGRFLWLRLTLRGPGTATPDLGQVRVHFPRVSSLQYLPAVYSEDPEARAFLPRFLSIFDSIRDGLTDRVARVAELFDPGAVPADRPSNGGPDFLTWLASWVGLTLDRGLPEARRRALLRNAHRLYALRGTREGLRLHVQLYTGREPRILEHFALRRWLFVDRARLGGASVLWGPNVIRRLQLDEHSRIGEFQLIDSGDPLRDPFHRFAHQVTVYLPAGTREPADEARALARIVEAAKPAHAQVTVRILDPRFRIGTASILGVDTMVARYPDEVVTSRGALGRDTVLGPPPGPAQTPSLAIGSRSRIGSSTRVD
jgi:phage tail-like protein